MRMDLKAGKVAMPAKTPDRPRVFTIGHSNHSLIEFVEMLQSRKLKLLVDVRKIPKSRHNPQFGAARLARSLKLRDIQYVYLAELAGRRKIRKGSTNLGWRNASFRAYADHMASDEFKRGLKRLMAMARRKRLVIMCAEAVPWRCHRRLIADALLTHGLGVMDIFSKTSDKPHELTPFAKVSKNGELSYPNEN